MTLSWNCSICNSSQFVALFVVFNSIISLTKKCLKMVYKFKYVGYDCLTVMLYGTLGYSSIKTQNGTI